MIAGTQYDRLKVFAQIILPILATLWFVIGQIWSFPSSEELVGLIIAVDALLGIFLAISQAKYNKGVMRGGILSIIKTDEGETFCLELGDDPEVLKTMKEVQFGIQNKWQDAGDLAAKT